MSWIGSGDAPTDFEAVLKLRPELLTRYRAFYATLFEAPRVPRRTLELCRLCIAAIHDCAAEWGIRDAQVPLTDAELLALQRGDFGSFAAGERAALEVAERMPFQQHAIEDEHVRAVEAAIGPAGAVALLVAVAMFDATCRLKLVMGVETPRDAAAQKSGASVPRNVRERRVAGPPIVLERPPLRDGALV